MNKALILVVSAFVFFFTFSCSNNSDQKVDAGSMDSISGDTLILKDSISIPLQNIFYPDSSADTNLVMRKGNISIYSIGNTQCDYNYDWVISLKDGNLKSFKLLEDNMVDLDLGFDSILIQELEVNNKGNKEVVIVYPVEGQHMYGSDFFGLGDDEAGGWSMNYKYLEVWDVDEMRMLFYCTPYEETWSKEGKNSKNYFYFHRYDFKITPDNSIVLSNLKRKVKDEIVPSKAKKADVKMGTYRFQNDSFAWIGFRP